MTLKNVQKFPFFSNIIVRLLVNPTFGQKLKNFFQQRFAHLHDTLETVYKDPNDQCVEVLKSCIDKQKGAIINALEEFETFSQINLNSAVSTFCELELGRMNLEGRVLKTTTHQWPIFAYELKTASYNKFSVVKQADELFVFFV